MAKKPENPDQPEEDRVELESLFKRDYRKVVYYFLRVGIPEEEARELAQETFLRAHRGKKTFRGESSESTWLFEIARNIYKNRLRDNDTLKKKHVEVPLSAPADDAQDGSPPGLEIADTSPLQVDLLVDQERSQELRRAVVLLPSQQRQCVELRLEDLRYHEIAAIMGISIETVKSHLHQARHALRAALRDSD